MIKEIIVVEGKDDVSAVKRAVDAQLIITHGYGFPEDLMDRIKSAHESRGVIVLTDPDFAGDKIRKRISSAVPGVRHAFIPREDATKDDDVGVENASPESIRKALTGARVESIETRNEFTQADMLKNGLSGFEYSSMLRSMLGEILSIGYANSKQFLLRLNNYGVEREEFENALDELEKRLNDRNDAMKGEEI